MYRNKGQPLQLSWITVTKTGGVVQETFRNSCWDGYIATLVLVRTEVF